MSPLACARAPQKVSVPPSSGLSVTLCARARVRGMTRCHCGWVIFLYDSRSQLPCNDGSWRRWKGIKVRSPGRPFSSLLLLGLGLGFALFFSSDFFRFDSKSSLSYSRTTASWWPVDSSTSATMGREPPAQGCGRLPLFCSFDSIPKQIIFPNLELHPMTGSLIPLLYF